MAFDLSSNLIQEIIPLYLISVLGFVAGRFLQIEAKPISGYFRSRRVIVNPSWLTLL